VVDSPQNSSSTRGSNIVAIVLKRILQLVVVAVCVLLLTVVALYVELGGSWAVSFQGGWGNWIRYCILGGWLGFVVIRIVLFFTFVLIARRLWRWSRTIGRALAGLIILGLLIFFVMTSYSPAGIYAYVDEIERWPPGEDYYTRFCAGKAEDVHKDEVFQWGHYEKTADGWLLTEMGPSGRRFMLKPSWFGIWKINAEFPEKRSLLGRRIVPFLLPDGWPQWLQ
jgi:hypothetical protein